MARIEEKIAEIADPALRQIIAEEVAKLKKHTRFGLVFEEHQPEVVPIYGKRIKRGERVAKKTGNLSEIWQVVSVKDGLAVCEQEKGGKTLAETRESFPTQQLVVIRSMGETIYPSLTPVNSVTNGDPAAPHHVLIEADNFHALQLLVFPYEGKVDCIYIDPPYNSGARDWKYNNDYVDGNDAWRHSKWLSMMQRRLRLAKRLLNPANSVLIVTIDEKEYLRLGLLLEQEFPDAKIQMVTSVINPGGASRNAELTRVNEFLFFVMIGLCVPAKTESDLLFTAHRSKSSNRSPIWRGLLRGGSGPLREDSSLKFFPVLVDPESMRVVGAGKPLPLGVARESYKAPDGLIAVWPLKTAGVEGRWELSKSTFEERLSLGYVRAGAWNESSGQYAMYYLRNAEIERIGNGELINHGMHSAGYLDLDYAEDVVRKLYAKTVWNTPSHDAGTHGSSMVKSMLAGRKFPFPKSLFAVEDALRIFVKDKRDAVVLDFFSGSGTTAHAVMRLNRQDGGQRQSVSITNNEVAADEQEALAAQGLQPGQPDWEKWGICNYITYPRLAAALSGKTPVGEPLRGDYKFNDEFPMAEGFSANLEYFRLDFLDPQEIQMGRQFSAILPILWMMAGSRGPRPDAPDAHAPWLLPDGCPFVVLMQETRFKEFVRHVESRSDLTHVFIVTNSQDTVYKLRHEWPELRVVQLYKDYLENFRINLSEKPVQ
jgi:adenine-specific DNA-methyltransferase